MSSAGKRSFQGPRVILGAFFVLGEFAEGRFHIGVWHDIIALLESLPAAYRGEFLWFGREMRNG